MPDTFMYFYLFCTISPVEKFHKAVECWCYKNRSNATAIRAMNRQSLWIIIKSQLIECVRNVWASGCSLFSNLNWSKWKSTEWTEHNFELKFCWTPIFDTTAPYTKYNSERKLKRWQKFNSQTCTKWADRHRNGWKKNKND